jgi:histidinol-phosphate aminotransferase
MFSERLKKLTPYVPGEQPQDKTYVKLNTNENPYPPGPRVKQALESYDVDRLRLYPDPLAKRLRSAFADAYGVKTENVFAGNGSDEVLSFCFYAFFDSAEGPLLFPEHTYSFYPVFADFYGIKYKTIPLNEDFSINVDPYKVRSCGIIVPNPNAPTGIYLELSEIERLLGLCRKDRVVVVDEAYIDFGGTSAAGLLDQHKNLVIVRTFSKSFSLANERLGFAIADKPLIDALFTVKDSFNSYPIDGIAQKIGETALEDFAYFSSINKRIEKTRDAFISRLRQSGWRVLPSKANFVFAEKNGVPGREVYERLKQAGVLVRHFNKKGIDDFVRISIGTPENMEAFVGIAAKLFGAKTGGSE